MIFVAGIHGVGKTFFCTQFSKDIGRIHYSSSDLISEQKSEIKTNNKKITQITKNQDFLFEALKKIDTTNSVLDGHFCLLNKNSEITRIPEGTFLRLLPEIIIVLTDTIDTIHQKLINRDQQSYDKGLLEQFQQEEIKYGLEISKLLNIPFHLFDTKSNLEELKSAVVRTTISKY
jgi:adenylate kinase